MSSQNEKKLEKFEPENENKSWKRHVKPVLIGTVALAVLIEVILRSVAQVGTLKSQSSEFSTPSFINFSANDLENLLEMKFFANASSSSVVRNMNCYVNDNKQECLNLEA